MASIESLTIEHAHVKSAASEVWPNYRLPHYLCSQNVPLYRFRRRVEIFLRRRFLWLEHREQVGNDATSV
ncbi:unnamed protein product [Larinioides sclopetarius]|uniref:Uncharacterized protein n=1 Tax=Larinioides sclopetarius TaxID=280406 RepID=A0AAV2BLZ3_9ARAC